MTIGTASGLTADRNITFTNACAVGDDFNIDSQSCWTVDDMNYLSESVDNVWSTWSGMENVLTFDAVNGKLLFESTGITGSSISQIYKPVALSSQGFEIVLREACTEGFDGQSNIIVDEMILAMTRELHGEGVFMGLLGLEGKRGIAVVYAQGVGQEIQASDTVDDISCNQEINVMIRWNGSSLSMQYDLGSGYQDFNITGFPTDISDYGYMGILFLNEDNDDKGYVQSIETTGVTSDGQY